AAGVRGVVARAGGQCRDGVETQQTGQRETGARRKTGARREPGARDAKCGHLISARAPGWVCQGCARPPSLAARKSSTRPKKSRLFSGRTKECPSSVYTM